MKHWTIKKRIISGFTVVFALCVVMSVTSFPLLIARTRARPEDRDQLSRVTAAREVYVKARDQLFELSRANKDAEAQALLLSTVRPLCAAYLKECNATNYSVGAESGRQRIHSWE